MFCPKDNTACYGDGNDSDQHESGEAKEPQLGHATDPAPSGMFLVV